MKNTVYAENINVDEIMQIIDKLPLYCFRNELTAEVYNKVMEQYGACGGQTITFKIAFEIGRICGVRAERARKAGRRDAEGQSNHGAIDKYIVDIETSLNKAHASLVELEDAAGY